MDDVAGNVKETGELEVEVHEDEEYESEDEAGDIWGESLVMGEGANRSGLKTSGFE